jgi:transposase
VIDAVAEMDLEPFYSAYRADGWGRAAFDPQMMVALLLYAYAIGERSARKIERRCSEDVAVRVIRANRIPDHATIARFRGRHEQALSDTFTQVLALCAQSGLLSVGLVALDGTLIAGNAAKRANRSYASIREEVEQILGEAAAVDGDEDARFGDARGDELPAELADPRSRRLRPSVESPAGGLMRQPRWRSCSLPATRYEWERQTVRRVWELALSRACRDIPSSISSPARAG